MSIPTTEIVTPQAETRPAPGSGEHAPAAISLRAVERSVRGARLLADMSLDVPARRLTAVVGSSGAGKSTLLEVMAGVAAPTAGSVRRSPGQVAYVPQEDLVHGELALRRSLLHAAGLRLPHAGAAERRGAVDRTLDRLGLSSVAAVRVADLSGGQRKRASIATELLGDPDLLLLDEPTSGLDPLRADEVTATLRRLVEDGMTVVVTTHDRSHLEVADHLVVLAPGGRVAFAGTPDAATGHFGLARITDVHAALERGPGPDGWVERYARSHPPGTAPPVVAGLRAGRPPVGRRRARRWVAQWRVLAVRSAEVTASSRLTLAIMAGSPALVVAMMAVLFPRHQAGSPTGALSFWMSFCAFFFGLTDGLLQVVTERPIARRERFAGVGPGAYVAAKATPILPVLVLAVVGLVAALRGSGRLPPLGGGALAELTGTLVLTSVAGLGLGLLASAAVADTGQATLALPMLCFPQVLFAGAVVAVDDMTGVGRAISVAMLNRWAYEATDGSMAPGAATPVGGWIALAALAALAAAGAVALVARLARPPSSAAR